VKNVLYNEKNENLFGNSKNEDIEKLKREKLELLDRMEKEAKERDRRGQQSTGSNFAHPNLSNPN